MKKYAHSGIKIRNNTYKDKKLNLAKGCNYTPDFRVIIPNCKITFVEVKGFKREAGRIKENISNLKINDLPKDE